MIYYIRKEIIPSSGDFEKQPDEGKIIEVKTMTCKNCGTKMSDNAKMCPNCGAVIDENEGYTLLTDDDVMFDIYENTKEDSKAKKKKGRGFIWFLSVLLTLLIIGGGAYYYFTNIYNPTPDKPELSFKSGCGIINDDEKIVYVLLDENSNIQYIHGVTIGKAESSESITPISSNYEYTKSVDSTFRAIFFDTKELGEAASGEYTFEMKFSFNDSEEVYTYTQNVTVPAEISEDASDLIFDHSQTEKTTAPAEETTESTTAQAITAEGDISFIYDSYWFTEPNENGDEMFIAAIKLNKDKSYVSTNYYKKGNESWQITTYNGKFKLENGFAVLDNGEATESTYYRIDSANKSLYEEENGKKVSTLTARKYNSIKNAEDFFGI